jgi:hypothetical protein
MCNCYIYNYITITLSSALANFFAKKIWGQHRQSWRLQQPKRFEARTAADHQMVMHRDPQRLDGGGLSSGL